MPQNKQPLTSVPAPSSDKRLTTAFIVILLFLAIGGGLAYWYVTTKQSAVTPASTVKNDGNVTPTSTEDAIARVVEKVSPSVVSIVTNTTQRTVFGSEEGQASGTGIILSKDGYILTNNHVIASATKVQVATTDGTIYEDVTVVGSEPQNDIAYLKIKGVNNLTPAELGDSSTLRVGQQVIAIGNALGQYQNTVSSGIISGKGRPIAAEGEAGSTESLTDLLQTDAAINPGNSGGPLLNFSGQVVGVNTAVASNAEGIGFAIPINATKGTLKSVLAGKGVERSYIGLRYIEISGAVAKEYKLPVREGAYLLGSGTNSAIVPGGPAEKSGLKEKDIVTKINGKAVGVNGGVATLVGEYMPGDTITVTYLRDGKENTTKVTLGLYPEN